jgi:predicted RNA binding protein YcfA (HicA-like mRNA interferase family)
MGVTLYPQVIAILRNAGCEFVRQGKGSHEIWRSPINQKNVSVPFTIKSKPTANAIFRQAGLNEKL